MKTFKITVLVAAAFAVLLISSAALAQQEHAGFDSARFEWSSSPADIEGALDAPMDTEHFGDYRRLKRPITLDDSRWDEFFIFYKDKLIAQGYEQQERKPGLRSGTISDVVSYDNDYPMATALQSELGDPDFKDVRTRKDFSEELGDDELRTKRTLQWDMLGERYRWETDDGTVRYTIQYSMDGLKNHRMVNVNPAHWEHYFEFQTVQAFREAGIELVRRFRTYSRKWVTPFSPDDSVKVDRYSAPSRARPRSAEREDYTYSNCRLEGESCKVTFHYYGGHLYQVDIDFSRQGEFPRTEHQDKIGRSIYEHFHAVDERLRRHFGDPNDSERIENFKDDREMMKAENIVQGQEGFWSMWYDVDHDTLVRHTITGESTGTGYKTDHKVSFRFHDVSRALAERDAWKAETKAAKEAKSEE
ncbi:MAG: hypothetical protein ACOCV2_13240 [Persicimonas sp.]